MSSRAVWFFDCERIDCCLGGLYVLSYRCPTAGIWLLYLQKRSSWIEARSTCREYTQFSAVEARIRRSELVMSIE